MRSRRVSLHLLVLAVALAACTRFTIRTRHDPSADFAGLHTYAWLPLDEADPADQRVLDRAVDARIRADVERDLRGKGIVAAGDAAPDMLLNYRIASTPGSSARGGPASGWWAGWSGSEAIYRENYDNGTLFLAVLDPREKRMIWLGTAQARLLPHISLEKRLKRVDEAVQRILEDFPPR